jgi:hypothetical protein
LIRHASPQPASAIFSLTVPVIKPSFRTLLVTTVGAAPLATSSSLAARQAAVALSAITPGAEEESRAAFRVQAKPLP